MLLSVISTTPTWRGSFLSPRFCSLREMPFSRRQTGEAAFFFHTRGKSRRLHRHSRRVIPRSSRWSISAAHEFSCPVRVEHAFAPQTSKLRRVIRGIPRRDFFFFYTTERIPCAQCVPRATRSNCALRSISGNYVLTVQHYRRQGTHPGRRPDT